MSNKQMGEWVSKWVSEGGREWGRGRREEGGSEWLADWLTDWLTDTFSNQLGKDDWCVRLSVIKLLWHNIGQALLYRKWIVVKSSTCWYCLSRHCYNYVAWILWRNLASQPPGLSSHCNDELCRDKNCNVGIRCSSLSKLSFLDD